MERHLAARVVSRQERGPGGGLPDSAGREQAPPLGQAFREEEDSLTALPRRLIQAAEDVHGRANLVAQVRQEGAFSLTDSSARSFSWSNVRCAFS